MGCPVFIRGGARSRWRAAFLGFSRSAFKCRTIHPRNRTGRRARRVVLIIPVLLKAKTPGGHFTGLEIQEECAELAQRSVAYNGLEQDIDIVCGDIKEAAEIFGAASFHAVTSNPPYMIGQHGLQNPYMAKAIARHEILCTLEDVVSQAARVLKDRGRFYMVHRPFRLAEIFQALTKYKLEPKRMQLVYPFVDREPNMVLIEALKGGNSRITVEKPLIVYEKPGVYTDEILKIYGPAGI